MFFKITFCLCECDFFARLPTWTPHLEICPVLTPGTAPPPPTPPDLLCRSDTIRWKGACICTPEASLRCHSSGSTCPLHGFVHVMCIVCVWCMYFLVRCVLVHVCTCLWGTRGWCQASFSQSFSTFIVLTRLFHWTWSLSICLAGLLIDLAG